jgi:branched-subunit amino acid ABC-type transport system permease component
MLSFYILKGNALLISFSGILLGVIITGLIGLLIEKTVIKYIYNISLERQLLATYGLLLVFMDLERMIWGGNIISAPQPLWLLGELNIDGYHYSIYYLLIIITAFSIGIAVQFLIYKTDLGILFRVVSYDREIASGLGISVKKISTLTFFISALLGGLAGSLMVPITSASLGMELEPLILSFMVAVAGGLGNFWGSLIASIIIGETRSIIIAIFPEIELALIYLIVFIILATKPEGILGRKGG